MKAPLFSREDILQLRTVKLPYPFSRDARIDDSNEHFH